MVEKKINNVDELKDRIHEIHEKTKTHLEQLKEVSDWWLFNADIVGNQKKIEVEIRELIDVVDADSELLTSLRNEDTQAAVYLNELKLSLDDPTLQQLHKQHSDQADRKDKLMELWKDKRALAAWVAWAWYGFYNWYNESTADIKSTDWFWSKMRKRTKWVFNGVFQWALRWWWAMLWVWAIQWWRDFWKKLWNGIDYALDPKKWAKDAYARVSKQASRLVWLLWIHEGSEVYDPANSEVAEHRLDQGYDEIMFHDVNKISLLNRTTWKVEYAIVWEEINVLDEEMVPAYMDTKFNDPTFTDQYQLTVKTINMRLKTAHIRVSEANAWEALTHIWFIEQDFLKFQQAAVTGTNKNETIASMKKMYTQIEIFEQNQKYVIWPDDRKDVSNKIISHTTTWSWDIRYQQKDDTMIYVMQQFRSRVIWDYGNSDVVEQELTNDLMGQQQYNDILKFFEHKEYDINKILAILAETNENTTLHQPLLDLISQVLKNSSLKLDNNQVASIANEMHKKVIHTYHEHTKRLNTFDDAIHKRFNTNFWWIFPKFYESSDLKAQQAQHRMIESYEATAMGQLETKYAWYPWDLTMKQRWDIVYAYALKSAEEQAMIGTLQHAYTKSFFYEYLWTKQTWSLSWAEKLLQDINGAGNFNTADKTWKLISDIWLNVALSLIPVLGAEMVIASVIARSWALIRSATIAWRVARIAIRASIWHTAMSISSWFFAGWSVVEKVSAMWNNFTDWKEFAKNAAFFNIVWRLSPWLQQHAKTVWKIAPTWKISGLMMQWLNNQLLTKVLSIWAESAVVVWTNLLDPDYEWSWSEFMTVAIMSLALQSKVWDKIRNYQFSKWADGKIVWSLNRPAAQLAWKAETQIANVWKKISDVVSKETSFTVWWKTYAYMWSWSSNGSKILKTLESWKRINVTEKEFQSILNKNYSSLLEKSWNKFFDKFSWSTKKVWDLMKQSGSNVKQFDQRCKTHKISRTENMLVGDLFKHIGQRNIVKLLFPHWFTFPSFSVSPTRLVAETVWKNKHLTFTLWSLLYWSIAEDDWDTWLDEWIENYMLYSLFGRTPIWFVLATMFDRSDIFI